MIHSLGASSPRIAAGVFIHPRATVIGDVEIGEDSSVWPGAVIRGDFGPIRIGARTSIQDNAVIHADHTGTVIGDDCLIAHLAFIEVATVGNACMVAVGAVLHGAHLHSGSVAAAGAVLVGGLEVPSGCRAQGIPARIVSSGNDTAETIAAGAGRYVEMARRYAAETQAGLP
jgi:carbonic anhydrase/acetyltransferase-like protein (isoleucine patch superfamily)